MVTVRGMQPGPAPDRPQPTPPQPTPPRPAPARPAPARRWPAILAAVVTGLWLTGVTAVLQAAGWLVTEVLTEAEVRTPFWLWPAINITNGFLALVPAVLLAILPKAAPVRAAGRLWTVASVALVVVGLDRAVPVVHNELTLAVLSLLALACARAAHRLLRRPLPSSLRSSVQAPPAGACCWLGFAAGLATLLPWLWLGSLGGLTETVLAALAALAVGVLAANVLSGRFGHLVSTALVLAVGLVLVAASLGGTGVHLAEMLVLPPLALAAAPLGRRGRGALVGTAAFGPLAFVDPEETSLLLGLRDIGFWTLVAALGSLTVGLLIGSGYALRLRARLPGRRSAALVAAATALAGIAVHVTLGHPGLYGERLFVVMRAQADLSGVTGPRPVRDRLVEVADRSQAPLRRELRRLHLDFTPYYLVNALEVDGGPAVRAWLSGRSDVDRVLLSPRLRPLPADATPVRGHRPAPDTPQWNVTMLEADRVWRELGVTGTGIVVGSSDSGVDGTHPALRDGFRGGDDSWYDPWRHSRTPTDHNGHGTHTTGTAVGATNVGIAPGATWVGCVNLDRNLGNPAHYLDCLQFMLAPFPAGGDPWRDGRPERAPQVLTNSWGCPELEGCDLGALRQATAAIRAAGIFFVAAAGNTGPRCRTVADPPAAYLDVLSVGAVDRQRRVTDFSSRGPAPDGVPKPDLVAPGVDVLSAEPGGGYATQTGTSMAAPHVAGVVALMWSANPRLVGDVPRTEEILRTTAVPVTTPRGSCGDPHSLTGAGLVDAYAAVSAARAAR
jgi:Subtilase family